MKALTCPVILEGASTRADNSLSLRFSTPELEPADMTAFFQLRNQSLKMLLQPVDEAPSNLHEIKGEFDRKSPSERLRNTLYVWHQQLGAPGDFQSWYLKRMEDLINQVKAELTPS